jgi:hypothetical protein
MCVCICSYICTVYHAWSQDNSSVGIAGRPRFDSRQVQEDFSLFQSVEADSGAKQVFFPMGIEALSTEVKWPGREADLSPPPSTEVKNGGAIALLPHSLSGRDA